MSDAQTPAGWFPDPEDPANLRYWDGAAWTDHRHPAEPDAGIVAPAAAGAAAAPAAQFAYQPTAGAQPGYVAPYGAAPAYGTPQNVPALVGLILAIVGAVVGLLGWLFILVAIAGGIVSIFGLTRATSMRLAGTPNDRRTLALAGIVVGFGGALLAILVYVALALVFYRPSF